MKTLKAICTATILAFALSIPTYAGDILVPGSPSPAPGTRVTQPASGDSNSTDSISTSTDTSQTLELGELLTAILSIF